MTINEFKALVSLTLKSPEKAARVLISFGWPSSARWMALLLTVTISALLTWLSTQISPLPEGQVHPVFAIISQPLVLAAMQFAGQLVMAGLMAGVGRIFDGKGNFDDALLLTVWIQVILLLVYAAQIVAILILPPLAGILGVIGVALSIWLLVQFTKGLHGFKSGAKVLMGIIGTAIALVFALSMLITALGIMPPMPEMQGLTQ